MEVLFDEALYLFRTFLKAQPYKAEINLAFDFLNVKCLSFFSQPLFRLLAMEGIGRSGEWRIFFFVGLGSDNGGEF